MENNTMKKLISINAFYLFLLTLVFLISSTGICQAKDINYNLDETRPIDKDGLLFLDSEDAEVSIIGTDRKDAKISVNYEMTIKGVHHRSGDDFSVEVIEENGNLRIREMPTNISYVGFVTMHRIDYTIEIEVPKTVSLRLRGEDDDYLISNINGEISLRMEDGDARLTNVNGKKYEFDLEDGEIEMSGGGGMLDISVEDGDVIIEDGKFVSINGRVEDGDIDIETTLADDGNYRLRADDGDLTFVVLGGGGDFTLEYDDGRARATRDFDLLEDDEDGYKEYVLPGGKARARFRVSDGSIYLKTR